MLKVSDYIVKYLQVQGVEQVYEVVGGMISHLIDSMHTNNAPRVVSMHHEQGASFAADATGRLTGVPGVAMATSGPGATNLLTGIGSCYFDSSPAVFITGQVNRSELKGDRPIRQLGFQEADIVSMATPITKAAWQAKTPEEIPALLEKAFATALEGRPGPVLLDIPMDLQRALIDPPKIEKLKIEDHNQGVQTAQVAEMLNRMGGAKRPLILVGGGMRSSGATQLFRQVLSLFPVPVVFSLMGVDVLPSSNENRVGLIGTYGNRWANTAIGESDFLLVLGSRLDIRQTGADTQAFKGDRTIVHVDCEIGETNNRVSGCEVIITHLKQFLEVSLGVLEADAVLRKKRSQWSAWRRRLNELKAQWPDTLELSNIKGINPNAFMRSLGLASTEAACYVVDVGQHQMWAAQSLPIGEEQRFITSGGMGAMGFSLPAAIGAALACPEKPVVLIAGDGSFQLNIQELETVRRNDLPIKMIILDNGCHGMVRQFQESYFEGRYQSTYWGYSAPDFASVAEAYGIPATTIRSSADLHSTLNSLWSDPFSPSLLRVVIDTMANAYPKIAFGRPMTEMEPFATPLAMEST